MASQLLYSVLIMGGLDMAKRLVAVMIVLIISFSGCGCVYKNKTVELDEVVEYEKACFEKAKEVVEAAGFNLSREKEKLNVETEHIMTSAYINMEDGSILINCVFYSTIQSYPTVYMKYEKKEEAKPYIKCSGMNIELFSQIIEIYTGIEITRDMYGELLYNDNNMFTDAGLQSEDSKYYSLLTIQPKGMKYIPYRILHGLGTMQYWPHGVPGYYTEDLSYSGWLGCCIEGMNKEVKY